MRELDKLIEEALNKLMAEEKPTLPKPEGERKKAAAGAHNPNKQTEYIQMKPDTKMKDLGADMKKKWDTSKQGKNKA